MRRATGFLLLAAATLLAAPAPAEAHPYEFYRDGVIAHRSYRAPTSSVRRYPVRSLHLYSHDSRYSIYPRVTYPRVTYPAPRVYSIYPSSGRAVYPSVRIYSTRYPNLYLRTRRPTYSIAPGTLRVAPRVRVGVSF